MNAGTDGSRDRTVAADAAPETDRHHDVGGAVDGGAGEVSEARAHEPPAGPDAELGRLVAELEAASELPLDDRLELLKRTEQQIARALEGLDGL